MTAAAGFGKTGLRSSANGGRLLAASPTILLVLGPNVKRFVKRLYRAARVATAWPKSNRGSISGLEPIAGWGCQGLRRLLNWLHSLFNPEVTGAQSRVRSLKYNKPDMDGLPDLRVGTKLSVPPDSPVVRAAVGARGAAWAADEALQALQGDLSSDLDLNVSRWCGAPRRGSLRRCA